MHNAFFFPGRCPCNCQGSWDLLKNKQKNHHTCSSLSFSSIFLIGSEKARTSFFFSPRNNRYSNLVLAEYERRIDRSHIFKQVLWEGVCNSCEQRNSTSTTGYKNSQQRTVQLTLQNQVTS